MAVVTFIKTPRTIENPFDGTFDNILDVVALLDGVQVEQYGVSFPDPTPDATIQAFVEADLAAKGYF